MVQITRFFLFIFFISSVSLYSEQFLYPVASYQNTDGNTQIFLIYQPSQHHIELWRWNPTTRSACKALLSHYIPAGLTILPNNKGFSFIDQGRLRIQYFHKRSPSTLDCPYPMYDFHPPTWLDEFHCYFSAKRLDHFCIFYGDMHNKTTTCLSDNFPHDSMYPQIINDILFFIHRTPEGEHSIVQTAFQQPIDNENGEKKNEVHSLLTCGKRSLAFLHMVSAGEGYFLEHPSSISRYTPSLTLQCYHFFKDEKGWREEQLFSFSIPMYFLKESEYRLYESILPFLPRYIDQAIIFTDRKKGDSFIDETDQTELCLFDIHAKTVHQITSRYSSTFSVPQSVFSPLVVGNKIFYGGLLRKPGKKNPDAFYAWIDDEGSMHTQLPELFLERVI